jgi:hypothetical protein
MKIISALALSATLLVATQSLVFAGEFRSHRDDTVNDTRPNPPDNKEPFDEGDEFSEQLPGHRDETVKDEMTCHVYPNWTIDDDGTKHDFVDFENTGTTKLPDGTKVSIVLPDGSVFEWEIDGWIVAGGTWGFSDLLPDPIPAGWDCTVTLTLPSPNP